MTRTMLRAIFITLSDLMSEVQLKSTKLTTNPKGSPIPQNTGDKRTGIKCSPFTLRVSGTMSQSRYYINSFRRRASERIIIGRYVTLALVNSFACDVGQGQNLICDHWAPIKEGLKVAIFEPAAQLFRPLTVSLFASRPNGSFPGIIMAQYFAVSFFRRTAGSLDNISTSKLRENSEQCDCLFVNTLQFIRIGFPFPFDGIVYETQKKGSKNTCHRYKCQ